jgi:hypothetical protein
VLAGSQWNWNDVRSNLDHEQMDSKHRFAQSHWHAGRHFAREVPGRYGSLTRQVRDPRPSHPCAIGVVV